jgi:hypothetical protein
MFLDLYLFDNEGHRLGELDGQRGFIGKEAGTDRLLGLV